MEASQRVSSAASFILQSPPGEINDIISDLRTIVDDDEALQTGIQPALEEYNKEQFVCVTAPGKDHQVRNMIRLLWVELIFYKNRLSLVMQG